ncbi:MAG: hypothetical protein HRF45_10510 [Fimbriimonadia bacterium]
MRRTVLIFTFVLTVTALALGVSADLSEESRQAIFDKMVSVMKKTAYLPDVTSERLDAMVEEKRASILSAESDVEFQRRVDAWFRTMGFSHLDLLAPAEAKRRTQGSMVGLGVELRFDKGEPEVVHVFPGSGADKIGLQPGDVILEIDGEKYDRQKGASGPVGTTFSLKYRTADGTVHQRRVVRQEFKTDKPLVVQKLDGNIGYLRVWSFMRYSSKEVAAALETLKDTDGLILDLRLNGGGSVMWMSDLLSRFLPERTRVGAFLSKGEGKDELIERPVVVGRSEKNRYKGKMVVLIDEGSASASEISAAALRETGRATLMGRKTAGAVLSSTYIPVGEGYVLQVPLQDYKTKDGVRLEGNGVKPDIELSREVVRPTPGQPDEAIEAARLTLLGKPVTAGTK